MVQTDGNKVQEDQLYHSSHIYHSHAEGKKVSLGRQQREQGGDVPEEGGWRTPRGGDPREGSQGGWEGLLTKQVEGALVVGDNDVGL